MPNPDQVDLLILGAGWTSTFLIPLCTTRGVSYAATTRSGRDGTIRWEFDSSSEEAQDYNVLPDTRTVLITFPIEGVGASERLVRGYLGSRREGTREGTGFVQLGTTGIWDSVRLKNTSTLPTSPEFPAKPKEAKWYDRHMPHASTARALAEDELLALSTQDTPTTVLNLAGLWGGTRSAHNWVQRVAPSKEALRGKGAIHLIHGHDLSRAILAVHAPGGWDKARGQRWMLTDGRVYDWWDLASAWGIPGGQNTSTDTEEGEEGRGPHPRWVRELMREEGVRALPRDISLLGRGLDSREFWEEFGLSPVKARLEE